MTQMQSAPSCSERPETVGDNADCLPPTIQVQAPFEPEAEVVLAFLSKDSLEDVSEELKGFSVLSSEGKYLVVGPSDVAPAYNDHFVPLEAVIARHKGLETRLSPHPCFIHRLPTEVLCAIFLMCGDQNKVFDYPRDELMDPVGVRDETTFYIRSTVIIGSVCWRWYTTTRGCPHLWTLVDVSLPQPRDISALRLSLKYSKGLPLTLRVNDFYQVPTRRTDVCQKFMTLVAASDSRWQEISIILHSKSPTVHEVVAPLLQVADGSFTSVKRAMLRFFADDFDRTTSSRLWQMLSASPALHVVQWFYVFVDAPSSVFQRLTHVGIEVILPEDLMALVSACPQLQVLQAVVQPADAFVGRNDGHLIQTLPAPIHLPHLRALSLRGMHDWTRFFDGITAPNIRRMEMALAGIQASAIGAMLSRSTARLDMLALRWVANLDMITSIPPLTFHPISPLSQALTKRQSMHIVH
ncbi:uncharacterized protein SCHCODRAFT_02693964 [Schizophyllum commune H4-8]|uniref:F-box domain-containing protein n=1 Tax=Schizophyllum commune (strain H4-8 / FGSC 9210) TaxID=578458 RepID=D8QKY7_SCHCM|nr:uncharacterized protein SCHCODRAFT_02693964 [Schizophyllum commune H4-8]KAI5885379.1 hypothetical protein SCHCODRAFT_02693964 [Schizophyllum commune H4-8]